LDPGIAKQLGEGGRGLQKNLFLLLFQIPLMLQIVPGGQYSLRMAIFFSLDQSMSQHKSSASKVIFSLKHFQPPRFRYLVQAETQKHRSKPVSML
jgi:hypothetical protein